MRQIALGLEGIRLPQRGKEREGIQGSQNHY